MKGLKCTERDLDLKRSFILRQGGGLVLCSHFLIMCGLFAGASLGFWGVSPKVALLVDDLLELCVGGQSSQMAPEEVAACSPPQASLPHILPLGAHNTPHITAHIAALSRT